ncbi:hypothetical protein AEM51_05605 [Bacteroidetes bacterium UKL13-3]|nr:hypothetical protein AEM51_05605 [Bacteroidetes bacterium UKL13-3]
MQKVSNIFTVIVLSLCILIGYTGVPIYKMMCNENGHTSVSISKDAVKCNHQTETKDCCKPITAQKNNEQPTGCCDFNNTFLQLHESSLVFAPQTSTGHILNPILSLFNNFKAIVPSSLAYSYKLAPPLLCRKQHQQSITQTFRI